MVCRTRDEACAKVTLGRSLDQPDAGARGGKAPMSSTRGGGAASTTGASGGRVSCLVAEAASGDA